MIVPHAHHKWQIETVDEIGVVRAQDMGLKIFESYSFIVVHFGDSPAECIARVVGHDQTILY